MLCLPSFILPWKQTAGNFHFFYHYGFSPIFLLLLIITGCFLITNITILIATYNTGTRRWKIILINGIILFICLIAFMFFNKEFNRLFENLKRMVFRPAVALLPIGLILTLLYNHPYRLNKINQTAYGVSVTAMIILYVFPVKTDKTFIPIVLLFQKVFSGSITDLFLLMPLFLSLIGIVYFVPRNKKPKPAKFIVNTLLFCTLFIIWVITINGDCPLFDMSIMAYSLSITSLLLAALLSIMSGYRALINNE